MPRFCKLTVLVAFGCLCGTATQLETQPPDRELKLKIAQSVDRAVAFLRRQQAPDGTWQHPKQRWLAPASEQTIGVTAMCGLALLEAGMDKNHDAVANAARVIRAHAKDLTDTQAIASALLFLDRYSQVEDINLIEALAKKLAQGQHPAGGWNCRCPPQAGQPGDMDSTLHASLALWVARSNGFNIDQALMRVEGWVGMNQQADGGWGQQFVIGPGGKTTPTATCAGLMVLAIGYRNQFPQFAIVPRPDLRADKQVLAGRVYLVRFFALSDQQEPRLVYFLWMLEHVGMAYEYEAFNGIEWYPWGAERLLLLQTPDGSWSGDVAAGRCLETAWALLFLSKWELAKDLNVNLGPPPVNRLRVRRDGRRQGVPGEARALREELRTVTDRERLTEILGLLDKTVGQEYTKALADAAPLVQPSFRQQVRGTLERRLERMSVKTLSIYLTEENKELRFAAVKAASAKKDAKDLIPEILSLLSDREPQVADAAHATLKKLSGKDLGRDPKAWQKWWDDGGI